MYLSRCHRAADWTGAELIPDPDAKRAFLEVVEEVRPGLDDRDWTHKVLSLAMGQAGLTTEIPLRFVTYAGHSGFAEALGAAVDDLQRGYIELALVGAIDSLVDERALNWLKLTGRLKCEPIQRAWSREKEQRFWPLNAHGAPADDNGQCMAESIGSRSLKKIAAG